MSRERGIAQTGADRSTTSRRLCSSCRRSGLCRQAATCVGAAFDRPPAQRVSSACTCLADDMSLRGSRTITLASTCAPFYARCGAETAAAPSGAGNSAAAPNSARTPPALRRHECAAGQAAASRQQAYLVQGPVARLRSSGCSGWCAASGNCARARSSVAPPPMSIRAGRPPHVSVLADPALTSSTCPAASCASPCATSAWCRSRSGRPLASSWGLMGLASVPILLVRRGGHVPIWAWQRQGPGKSEQRSIPTSPSMGSAAGGGCSGGSALEGAVPIGTHRRFRSPGSTGTGEGSAPLVPLLA